MMEYYVENLNNDLILNPIRDGIPQCVKHPFDPKRGLYGCVKGCKKDLLPVARDYSVQDVFYWVWKLIEDSYKSTKRSNKWSGVLADILPS